MALIPPIKDNDWVSVRQALQKVSATRLGPDATPTFAGISIQGNATVSTFDAVSATISAGTFVSLYAQSFTCLSATISAGTFNSIDLGRAYSSSFVVLSAVVSAGTFTSIDFTRLAGISATISALAVTSLSGVTLGGVSIVTALLSSPIEGDVVYLNSNTQSNIYIYKEL